MAAKLSLIVLFLIMIIPDGWTQGAPNKPEAKPITLDSKTTAILVLDLNARCENPKKVCSRLMPAVGELLEKARASSIPIIYSVSGRYKGKPSGEIASPLKRREGEPVVFPKGFDKFAGGKFQGFLKPKGIKNVVIVGSSTNMAVLYTATTAARNHRYNVIIPMDGVNTRTQYSQEYTFHHFTVLRGGANKRFKFTKQSMITFK